MNLWHWLTTSRYTRYLEQENAELKDRNRELESVLIPRLAQLQASAIAKAQAVQSPAPANANNQRAIRPPVKTCTDCGAPYTQERCPNCGSMKTKTAIAAAPQFRRFKGFSRVKEEIEGQVSEATNSN